MPSMQSKRGTLALRRAGRKHMKKRGKPMAESRMTASTVAESAARRLREKAWALEIIGELCEKHLEKGSREEAAVWDFISSIPTR